MKLLEKYNEAMDKKYGDCCIETDGWILQSEYHRK